MLATLTALASLLVFSASAQDTDTDTLDFFTLHPTDLVLGGGGQGSGTILQNGFGRPTVAFDHDSGTWVGYLSVQLPTTFYDTSQYTTCSQGVWGLARMTSPDGLAWTVESTVILKPQPGTYYSCVVAQPNVLYDGDTWHMWFKTEQPSTYCDSLDTDEPEPTWGCHQYTGIGYATSSDGINFTPAAEPVLTWDEFEAGGVATGIGYPSVVVLDDVWYMLIAKVFEEGAIVRLVLATSPDGAEWTLDSDPVLNPTGANTWMADEVFNPAMMCEEEPESPGDYLSLFFGGRDHNGTPDTTTDDPSGFGMARSEDFSAWYFTEQTPIYTWEATDTAAWKHWTAVRAGTEYLVYYVVKSGGVSYLRLAYTAAWDEGLISNRICDLPEVDTDHTDVDPGETDSATETDDSAGGESPADSPAETDDSGDPNPCDGDAGGGGGCCKKKDDTQCAWIALPLFPLLGLRRRRRG